MKEIPAFESRRVRTQPRIVTGASFGARPARMSRIENSFFVIYTRRGGWERCMGDKAPTVYARALERAADILGGKEPLRAVLRVPMIRLDEWLAGHSEPPLDIFLRAVDVIS